MRAFKAGICGLAFATILSGVAASQETGSVVDPQTQEVAEKALDELVLDTVRVQSGNPFWIKGIRAFRAGDYALAEQEFTTFKNQVAPAVLLDQFSTGGQNGIFFQTGGFVVTTPGLRASPNITRSGLHTRIGRRFSNSQIGIQGARTNYAFASFWAGMSQIRQGDYEEARRSMMRAIRYDKTFHEARMRVGLIDLLEGKPRQAKRRLAQLERWCGNFSCSDNGALGTSYTRLKEAIETYELSVQTGYFLPVSYQAKG